MNNYTRSFRQLIVWQKSEELTLTIYQFTSKFPSEEKFGVTSQLRRAASSIMANIAEGNERKTKAECQRFLEIARGSLVEVDCFVDLAYKLKYLSMEQYKTCTELMNKTGYLLAQFTKSQKININRI
jgi:four helix bundle protein